MAELGHEMDVDSRPPVPPRQSEPPQPWDISKVGETMTASLNQLLGPIRRAVREEVEAALNCEQRPQNPLGPDSATEVRKLLEQLHLSQAERDSLSDQVNRLKKDADQARFAISERDKRNKKLQQVIIENSQSVSPPMDDEIVTLFNQLNQEIMKIVKKHFNRSMIVGRAALESAPWKEFKPLTPENRELWVRAFIADDLYDEFFRKDRRIFGFDGKREDVLKEFESALAESGKVSEADIVDWRIRTISCGQKLGLASSARIFQDAAHEIVRALGPVAPRGTSEQKEAEKAMAAIYHAAHGIAIMFRSNTVSYSWLQKKSAISIQTAEGEIIGSANTSHPADKCRPWRIIFGGVVKNQDSEEDRVVLTKTELLVN